MRPAAFFTAERYACGSTGCRTLVFGDITTDAYRTVGAISLTMP